MVASLKILRKLLKKSNKNDIRVTCVQKINQPINFNHHTSYIKPL